MKSGQSEQQCRVAESEFAAAAALRAVYQAHEHVACTAIQFARICDIIGHRYDGATPEEIAHIVYGVQRLWDCYHLRERESGVELR